MLYTQISTHHSYTNPEEKGVTFEKNNNNIISPPKAIQVNSHFSDTEDKRNTIMRCWQIIKTNKINNLKCHGHAGLCKLQCKIIKEDNARKWELLAKYRSTTLVYHINLMN